MKKIILSLFGVALIATAVYAASTQMKNTGAGLYIGTASTQKIGFFGAAPIVRPTISAAGTTTGSAAVALTQSSKAASTAVALTQHKATIIYCNGFDTTNTYASVEVVTNVTVNAVYGFASDTPVVITNEAVNAVYGFTTEAQANAVATNLTGVRSALVNLGLAE
jgi:hypothetical protein